MRAVGLVAVALAGCATEALVDSDAAYYAWDDQRVICGIGVDGATPSRDELEAGMIRARERGEVLTLYAHQPGGTVSRSRIAEILEVAAQVQLVTVTFPELAARPAQPRAGLSLGFDDAYVQEWYDTRDLLAAHEARVTFFVSNFGQLTAEELAMLHVLAGDGHAIEAHGMGHRNAPHYVDEHGVADYVGTEIVPELEAMRTAGFAPTTFAYPYGDRTEELDAALLGQFQLLRSLTYLDRSTINSSPCPR